MSDKKTIVEVTLKKQYVLYETDEDDIKNIMNEWFVKYANSSHAYRDGNEVFGIKGLVDYKIIGEIDGNKFTPRKETENTK